MLYNTDEILLYVLQRQNLPPYSSMVRINAEDVKCEYVICKLNFKITLICNKQ